MPIELYTTSGCPYSAAAREDLEWRGVEFVEYDVEHDSEAYGRMQELIERTIVVQTVYGAGQERRQANHLQGQTRALRRGNAVRYDVPLDGRVTQVLLRRTDEQPMAG